MHMHADHHLVVTYKGHKSIYLIGFDLKCKIKHSIGTTHLLVEVVRTIC